MKKQWMREPTLHFVLISVAIFLLNAWLNPHDPLEDTRNIVVDDEVRARLRAEWARKWGREPQEKELEFLVDQHIRDEVYHREAIAMGLDRKDVSIRRRLIQKITFLSEDVVRDQPPSDAELRKYFAENAEDFRVPMRYTFRHVFFSRGHRNYPSEDAKDALMRISLEADEGAEKIGDAFLGRSRATNITALSARQEFGERFEAALAALPVNRWAGPIESEFGSHVVFLEAREESRIPAFEEAKTAVRMAFEEKQRRAANARAFEAMRKNYTVLVQAPKDAADAVAP